MKSATLDNRHLRGSDAPVCMFHTAYIIGEYCFPFELVHLKVDISLSIDTFFMSVNQVYTEFRSFMLKFTKTETTESASCLLSLFYKSAMFCYCECTQINESLQILLLSV